MADTRIDELRRRLERDPGSRLFAQLAEELRKNGDLAEAIRVARAGLGVHPAYASARLTLGRALLDSGDAIGARAELENALRDAPDNIQASRYLAQAREQLGDLKGAVDQYRKTLVMAPEDRQLQAALAAVEAGLNAPRGDVALGDTTPPGTRRGPPPLPARAAGGADAPQTPGRGTAAPVPPLTATLPVPLRAGSPPVVLSRSRPLTAPEPEPTGDFSSDGEPLPATLRIHASQTGAPAQAPPARAAHPPAAPPPPPAPLPPTPPTPAASPEPTSAVAAQAAATVEAAEPRTLPGTLAPGAGAEPATESASGSTTPFSSSTLAELYFQQGLVDRALDVYRQLLEQEPQNEKARQRLDELQRAAPVADERAARRRALERTIAGLETLLGAVRSR